MFEDLRKDGEDSPFFQQKDEFDPLLDAPSKKKRSSKSGGGPKKGGLKIKFNRKFLGMTAAQRFAVAFALFIMVSAASVALLVVTGSIVLISG